MENEVFVVDAETLAEAVKKAGYAYADEYGWDNRFSDFNLYLQENLGDHIKEVGADEISRRSDSDE